MKTAVALVLLAFFLCSASATPGRLDGSGCHNSKRVGYHCHRAQQPEKIKAAKVRKASSVKR